jgi:hypothetical protein
MAMETPQPARVSALGGPGNRGASHGISPPIAGNTNFKPLAKVQNLLRQMAGSVQTGEDWDAPIDRSL